MVPFFRRRNCNAYNERKVRHEGVGAFTNLPGAQFSMGCDP